MAEATKPGDLSQSDWRIVEAMYRLMPNGPRVVTYEDIVVEAWKLYPAEFGLRGYSDLYPDSSDVHKRLYLTLRARGFVAPGPKGQKRFKLTPSGWERAQRRFEGGAAVGSAAGRALRTTELEVRHLSGTEALRRHLAAQDDEVLDTDFFAFYRTSVRADPHEFEGRLAEVDQAIRDAEVKGLPGAAEIRSTDRFLRERFAQLIDLKREKR
jgi:hypothetical protein